MADGLSHAGHDRSASLVHRQGRGRRTAYRVDTRGRVRGYHRVSEWLEVGVFGAGNPGFHQPLDAGNSDSGDSRRDYRFVDGGRNDSFDDVLWY